MPESALWQGQETSVDGQLERARDALPEGNRSGRAVGPVGVHVACPNPNLLTRGFLKHGQEPEFLFLVFSYTPNNTILEFCI